MPAESTVLIVADGYFDGARHHGRGPYTIALAGDRIRAVRPGATEGGQGMPVHRAAYVLPGLVEAHAHLFLDGSELDLDRRSAYLAAPRENMLATGRHSLDWTLAAGVTLVRDAGDIHGINVELRREVEASAAASPRVRCPGVALRKAGRYGSFMAREVGPQMSIEALMNAIAPAADEFKILLTGIIDFDGGSVKGAPQFNAEEASRIGRCARALGRRTFAHCSGADGIDIALDAGFDSIEHGFFVTSAQLRRMAESGVAWVPTFSPVYFQWAQPQIVGWSAQAVGHMRRILDEHSQRLNEAYALGVPVMAGSDAGSHGVPHGLGLIDELVRMADAGVATERLLASATTLPRTAWGCEPVTINPGSKAELVLLQSTPMDGLHALRDVSAVYLGGRLYTKVRPSVPATS
ncbi:MAG: amidohydrolase [Pseudomonadota bacterium]